MMLVRKDSISLSIGIDFSHDWRLKANTERLGGDFDLIFAAFL